MEDRQVNEHVFVVRFWPDNNDAAASTWRGHAYHVGSEAREFFVELSALDAFISTCLHAIRDTDEARHVEGRGDGDKPVRRQVATDIG